MDPLPQPDYGRRADDPAWLARVVQFHGHLGPAVVAGARLGAAGRRVVEAKGYFDVEVSVEGPLEKPPQSCFLDGVQVATGATLGKRSLHWTPAEKIVVRVKNAQTGKTAEVRPTPKLLELLAAFKPRPKSAETDKTRQDADAHLEAIARKIAAMPEAELAMVKVIAGW